MIFFLKTGISPLQARASGKFYFAFLAGAIIIGCALCVWIILKLLTKSHDTPEWKEQEKNRPTKLSDIKKLAATYGFTKDESNLLFDICKEGGCLNFFYSFHDVDTVDELFINYYYVLKNSNASPQAFSNFFKLRHKISHVLAVKSKIGSTEFLPDDSFIFFVTADGELFPLKMVKNEKTHFTLEMPEHLMKSDKSPKVLEHTRFMYKALNGVTYLFISRPIRFEEQNNVHLMHVSHTTKLHTQTQRQFQREFVNEDCLFSSTKENAEKFPAKLINISGGGCCIHGNLPLKENQKISIYFPKLGIDDTTVGIIRHTRIIPEKKMYALHIQFTDISLETQNRIYSFVYKFEI